MPKKLLIFPAVLIGLVAAAAAGLVLLFRPPAPAAPIPERSFALSGVTLINPGRERVEDAQIDIVDGRIAMTSSQDGTPRPHLKAFRGCFILPGLVDMHSHLPPDNLLSTTGQYGALYLLHGVTSIRDAGDVDGTAIGAAAEAVERGVPMPRIYSAGPFLTTGETRWPNSLVIDSPDEARDAVRRIKAGGHTWIKSYENLTVPMLRAIEDAAGAEGMGVLGHVPHELAYEEALIRDVQHFLGIPDPDRLSTDSIPHRLADWDSVDEARMDTIVETTLEYGIANTPTLVISRNLLRYRDYAATLHDPVIGLLPPFYPEIVWSPEIGIPVYRSIDDDYLERLARSMEKKKILLKRLHDAGATLRLGTDQQQPFTVPGASLHDEMSIFVEAGIPLEQVWAMATRQAGAALASDGLGEIRDGAPADLLIFREDPTQSFDALASLEAVVVRGRLFHRAEIEAAVDRWNRHWRHPLRHKLSNAVVRRAVDRIAGDFDE